MLILVVESISFYRFNYHEVSFLRINRQLIGCSGVSKFLAEVDIFVSSAKILKFNLPEQFGRSFL